MVLSVNQEGQSIMASGSCLNTPAPYGQTKTLHSVRGKRADSAGLIRLSHSLVKLGTQGNFFESNYFKI